MPGDPHSSELASAMLEEWKVIQTKIDKIGEFRFHIKNWTATVAVAFIVGLFVTNASPYLVLIALLPTWGFFFVEKRQEKILHVLMTRAARLELASHRLAESRRTALQFASLEELLGAVGTVPGTAGALRTFSRSRKFNRAIFNEAMFYVVVSIFIILAVIGDFARLDAKDAADAKQRHHVDAKITLPEPFERSFERLSLAPRQDGGTGMFDQSRREGLTNRSPVTHQATDFLNGDRVELSLRADQPLQTRATPQPQ